ncbi:hypothetical protein FZEAL_4369 [Fusarium zealandicum]|uniref:Uncharacterized protein n=1 Tax=Fusarium zealandicum TaxID=1053134 RepID=A0A8H4ULV2_9HYPO|nr:hypothetical protein FZEAL_4369 [Fusarium zealandicum]
MGFFSFLTRNKASADRKTPIRSQAYHSTVASIPPIHGTYPVAGNGPNVLDQLQQAARKRSQPQLSTPSHDIDDDPAAPPPMVPRFRSFSPGRPTTAPNHGNSFFSRPRSVARSIRSTHSARSVPEKARVRTDKLPPVPIIPTHHHRREPSIDSFQESRFVDVLDAQGELKPASFRSRVKATGAREFGEDVAERNIGENSLNLNSAAVKAFYRLSGGGRLALQTSESGGLTIPNYDTVEDYDDDDCAPPPGVPHGDLGTIREAWSRPTSSSAWRSFSGSIGADMLRSSKLQRGLDKLPDTSQDNRGIGTKPFENRRKSFIAFASTPEAGRSKPRPLSLHPSMFDFDYGSSSPPPLPRSRPKTSEGRDRRRSLGRVEIESVVDEEFDTAPCPTVPVRYKQTDYLPETLLETTYTRPDTRHAHLDVHHIRPETHHGLPALSGNYRSDASQPISRPSSSSSIDKPHPRTRSIGASSHLRNQRLDNITEHIPIRTSSLTVQTQPCVTPTTMSSEYSSHLFPRSLGQHTPNTSIDASLPPSIKLGHDREQSSGMASLGNQGVHYTAVEEDFSADTLVPSRSELEQDLSHSINTNVEEDYYISDASEDSIDSFVEWKAQRRAEETLLFKDHYGVTGDGLPGLFEPLPIPRANSETRSIEPQPIRKSNSETRSIKPPKTPKSPKSPRRPTTRSNKSTPRKTRSQPRSHANTFSPPRRAPEPPHGSSSDDEDSDSFWEKIPAVAHGPGFVSLADLGIDLRHLGLDQYGLTEEDDAKVDIRTAMKLRKEMKRRKMETRSRRQTQLYVGRRREHDELRAAESD